MENFRKMEEILRVANKQQTDRISGTLPDIMHQRYNIKTIRI